ncbi:MAG: hypothetical protein HUJ26_09675 [Planctomycetaceae bacterium]|nr:hypothetical protein [Planctomycetaceae bacterium]
MDTEPNDPRIAVVVSFQQLPLKLFSAYGSELGQTPHFDRMASRGVLFDQHFADDLGEDRLRHAWWDGMTTYSAENESNAGPSLAEQSASAGIECHLISDSPPAEWEIAPDGWDTTYLESSSDSVGESLSQLFSTAESILSEIRGRGAKAIVWIYSREMPSIPIPEMTFLELYLNELPQLSEPETEPSPTAEDEEETEDVEENAISEDERTAAFELIEETLSLISTENAEPESLHIKTLNVLAAARLSEWDHELGKFFDRLEPEIDAGRSVFFLTSDRGLPLWESAVTQQLDRHQHSGPIQEETAHLPLLLVHGNQDLGERHGALTSPADLPASLLDWFGMSSDFPDGRSLWSLVRGDVEELHTHLTCRAGDWESLREPEWLLIRNRRKGIEKLYIKPEDRWQVLDVLSQYIDEADRLISLLNQSARS